MGDERHEKSPVRGGVILFPFRAREPVKEAVCVEEEKRVLL